MKSAGRQGMTLDRLLDEEFSAGERQLLKLEPAWGKAALALRTGTRVGHATGSVWCMSLLDVHRMLEVFRDRFDKGDTLSLLQAVGMCAEENVPLPTWLAEAFGKQMRAFLQPGAVRSVDEVFASKALPTGSARRSAVARQDWQLGGALWRDALELAAQDAALQSVDQVVERLLATGHYGVGKTKAKALIAMVGTNQSAWLGRAMSRFRDFWPNGENAGQCAR